MGDPLHRIVQWFGYDEIGNRLWVTDGNGSTPQDPNHTTWYDYDDNNNLVCITDALGGQTQYRYDALNRKDQDVRLRSPIWTTTVTTTWP